MRLPSRSTMRSDLRAATAASVQLRARKNDQIGGRAGGELAACAKPHGFGGVARHRGPRRSVGLRMVEMEDAGALAEHLEPVEIAIGVERVARVVRGDGDGDAGGRSSWSSVTPRQRGVRRRPSSRSCRYMLHIGSETTAMPASATRSMVRLALVARPARRATQQWPAMTLPVKPVSMHRVGEVAQRGDCGSSVSSTWRSRSRPSSPAFSTTAQHDASRHRG